MRLLTERVSAWQEHSAGGVEVTIEARPRSSAPLPGEDAALLVVDKVDHVFVVTAALAATSVEV
ncbi:hypothetical protein [Streptomyces sp. SID13031]|uniref:hypothetical protein n=1 Tax=Streptomyces sp. SID13031 TaxID=2706046 RepID=UPI0013CC9D25|nr:hypothetical protein [Streptomyces sp. SID13031]NEA35128.1 hypothetical protein [Streptomyces sp. SID13031]